VLATLAIVVWHFYQVFFDPDVYPMNWAWWDGKMTLHHYRDEHGLDPALIEEQIAGQGKSSGETSTESAGAPGGVDIAAQPEDPPGVTGTNHGQ